MKLATPKSPLRRKARREVQQVIEDHVRGPAECLTAGDVLELRRVLRDACPWRNESAYHLQIWREEVRLALGYVVKKPRRRVHRRTFGEGDVMPAMREWARAKGLIPPEPEAEELPQ